MLDTIVSALQQAVVRNPRGYRETFSTNYTRSTGQPARRHDPHQRVEPAAAEVFGPEKQ